MKIWPAISRTTLKDCNIGAIVHVAGLKRSTCLAIVCMVNDGAKGLIYLADREAKFRHDEKPELLKVFRFDEDAVLLLDHASALVSYEEEIGKSMGLVVLGESGWYLNVRHVNSEVKTRLQYCFKHKTVGSACESEGNEGIAFKNWKLVLLNSHVPHAEPKTIFSMKLS